jgi:hypothetical protein
MAGLVPAIHAIPRDDDDGRCGAAWMPATKASEATPSSTAMRGHDGDDSSNRARLRNGEKQ